MEDLLIKHILLSFAGKYAIGVNSGQWKVSGQELCYLQKGKKGGFFLAFFMPC